MPNDEAEYTEESRFRGSAEATAGEKAAVGGEKTLTITNHLIQSNANAQTIADILLLRLKNRKKYFVADSEFCPLPIEIGDTILAQERIASTYWDKFPYGDSSKKYGDDSRLYRSNGIVLAHTGEVRDIKLIVTPTSQTLNLTLEV